MEIWKGDGEDQRQSNEHAAAREISCLVSRRWAEEEEKEKQKN